MGVEVSTKVMFNWFNTLLFKTIFLPLVESTTQLKKLGFTIVKPQPCQVLYMPLLTTVFSISMLVLGFKRIPLSPFQKNTVWWHKWDLYNDSLKVLAEEELTMNDVIPLQFHQFGSSPESWSLLHFFFFFPIACEKNILRSLCISVDFNTLKRWITAYGLL